MVPRLSHSKLVLISDMIENDSFKIFEMREQTECSKQTIVNISNNFGNLEALTHLKLMPSRKKHDPLMIGILCDHQFE